MTSFACSHSRAPCARMIMLDQTAIPYQICGSPLIATHASPTPHQWRSWPIQSRIRPSLPAGTSRGALQAISGKSVSKPVCSGSQHTCSSHHGWPDTRVCAATALPSVDTNSHLQAQWHPSKNGDRKPSDYTLGSSHRAWWLCTACPCGCPHEWQARIYSRAGAQPSECPVCAGGRVCACKSLAKLHPEIAAQLDPDANGDLQPEALSPRSSLRLSWVCNEHETPHRWTVSIAARTKVRQQPTSSRAPVCTTYSASMLRSTVHQQPVCSEQVLLFGHPEAVLGADLPHVQDQATGCPACAQAASATIAFKRKPQHQLAPSCNPNEPCTSHQHTSLAHRAAHPGQAVPSAGISMAPFPQRRPHPGQRHPRLGPPHLVELLLPYPRLRGDPRVASLSPQQSPLQHGLPHLLPQTALQVHLPGSQAPAHGQRKLGL